MSWLFCFGAALAQEPPIPTFGTTVVISSGIKGEVYHIRPTKQLPKLEKKKPKGEIYTTRLDIPSQDFTAGFPGVTSRNEWFAILYEARFWIEAEGTYRFRLLSDDGSKLYIDNKLIIDNDGLHVPIAKEGSVTLTKGVHEMRLPYFQGPRYNIALVLEIAKAGQPFRIFDTKELQPPKD